MTDFIAQAKSWLQKSGYPLEMSTASALRCANFSVVQSEYFQDAETGKWREADIVAYSEERGETCRAIFALIVECKSSRKDKPWILFTADDAYPPRLAITRRATNESGRSILNALAAREDIQRSPLFTVPKRPAFGLAIAHADNNRDAAFDALNAVCKASLGFVRRISGASGQLLIPFAWPIVVTDAPLLESYLDNDGSLQVASVEDGLIIWRNPIVGRHTLVQIFTLNKLKSHAKTLFESSQEFVQAVATENASAPRQR
jgi:hypothetical protein